MESNPVDRRAHGLQPGGRVTRATGQDVQPLVEPVEKRPWRQNLDSGGSELDRERKTVEPPAEFGHCPGVFFGQRKIRPDRAGSLQEQFDCLHLAEFVERDVPRGVKNLERGNREFLLTQDAQRDAAGNNFSGGQ